jgi:Na+/H+ antiporter NhaC
VAAFDQLIAKHRRRLVWAVACVLALALLPLAGVQQLEARSISWTALLPTALTLSVVLVSGRIVLALVAGVLAGSIVAFGPVMAVPSGFGTFVWSNLADPWHLYICGFALSVLGMVKIVEASGGLTALVRAFGRRLASARATKLGSFGAGLAVFFDDYANTFLVGSCMRPLADRHGVSREKLSYIVDSTAAPVAGLVVVSTWLTYELGLLETSTAGLALEHESYALLLQALPFRFYCIFALALVFISSLWERDLGPMVEAEERARRTPPSHAAPRDAHEDAGPRNEGQDWHRASVAIVPIATLVAGIVVGLLNDGGAFAAGSDWLDVGNWGRALVGAESPEVVLFRAAVASTLVALLLSVGGGSLTLRAAVTAFGTGVKTGGSALLILFGAWALGDASKFLGAGPFLVTSLQGVLPGEWLAILTFLIAAGVAFATGTSFGTMGILLPAVLPLAHGIGGEPLLILSLAAVLDGAIFGDHCSPVSDTTLLSSTACDCDVMAHVRTQLPYALLAMCVAGVALFSVSWQRSLPAWLIYVAGVSLLTLALRLVGRPLTTPPR